MIGLLALVAASTSGTAISHYSGNQLWDLCSGNDTEYAACALFVMGVADTVSLQQVGGTHRICIDPTVSKRQMADVVSKSLHDIPETRNLSAAMLAYNSLLKAFPCAK